MLSPEQQAIADDAEFLSDATAIAMVRVPLHNGTVSYFLERLAMRENMPPLVVRIPIVNVIWED